MKILVCIKQVPDTNEVKTDPKTGTLIRDGVPSIINPDDKNALEAALALKDQNPDAKITVLTMGPPQAEVALREALAMGCDDAVLITDRAFGGSDTYATSNVILAGINAIGEKFNIIFCGRQAIDGDTAQVGPQIAEKLNIPQITYAGEVKVEGDKVIVKRMLEDGYMMLESPMPCLITAVKELNEPRYANIGGIVDAHGYKIRWVTANDVQNLDLSIVGLKGSPTNVFRSFTPKPKGAGEMIGGADQETMTKLLGKLKAKHIL